LKNIVILLAHLPTTFAKLLGPSGAKAIIAENLFLKQQLLVVTRSRRRALNLSTADRFLMGFWSRFSPKTRANPGPKGPSDALIRAIVELKRRNTGFGCPRIALIISKTFGIQIDKHVVRRALVKHYRPESGGGGPSWLTFLGDMKDRLRQTCVFLRLDP